MWSLPYSQPLPPAGPARTWAAIARVAGYVLVIGGLLTATIQFQHRTMANLKKAARHDARLAAASAPLAAKRPKETAAKA